MNTQTPILILGVSLLGLVIINIILGSISSFFQQQFDKVKFIQGIIKGLVVVLCFVGVIEIAQLTPNIFVINIDGKDLSLLNATYLLMLWGYYYYGKQVYVKLVDFISGNKITNIQDIVSNVVTPSVVSPNEQDINKPVEKPVVDNTNNTQGVVPTPEVNSEPVPTPTPKENPESQTS